MTKKEALEKIEEMFAEAREYLETRKAQRKQNILNRIKEKRAVFARFCDFEKEPFAFIQ